MLQRNSITHFHLNRCIILRNRGKKPSSHHVSVDYHDVKYMIDIESYWSRMEELRHDLIKHYTHNLVLRSSGALDDLLVKLEGDNYPLHEIASISKRDPKRILIDVSSFPSAASSVVESISKSGLNVNPQQDGTKITVPIPKVTKEYREKLAKAAKAKFSSVKDDYRHVQNTFISVCKNKEMDSNCKLPREKFHSIEEIILAIGHHFTHLSENDFHKKQNELLGGK